MGSVKLSEITSVITKGTTPTTIGFNFQDEGINFVKVESIAENGEFIKNKFQFISNECNEKMNRSKLEEDDILFSIAGALGRTAIVSKEILPANINQALAIIRLRKEKKQVTPKYLKIALNSKSVNNQFQKQKQGVAQLNLSLKNIGDLEIPLPPLEKQKQITKTLDTAAELLAMRKQQLAELDNLIKSIFLNMFGDPAFNNKMWELKGLREISECFSDGPFGSNLKSDHYQSEGIRVIRLQNIGIGEFIDNDKAFISEDHYKSIIKHSCYPGDLLLGTIGNPNLRACILPNTIGVAINKADCIRCKPNKKVVLAEYLCHLINNPQFQNIVQTLIHGQTRSRISMGQLAGLSVPVPPIHLQNQFALIVTKIEEQKAFVQNSIDESQQLFDSLMSENFE